MPCIHKEKLKSSRLRCHLLRRAVIYGLVTPSHQIRCRGWVPLFSCHAGQGGTAWWASCQEGPPGMALLRLGCCHWYFSLRRLLAEGLHKKRSQIPGTVLPLQHTDHFYSPVNNHFVSYLVLKLYRFLKWTWVEDYFRISARAVHIFPLKKLQECRRPVSPSATQHVFHGKGRAAQQEVGYADPQIITH